MKYLVVGLGNPGDEYKNTRHNVGYLMADAFAGSFNSGFQDKRYGYVAQASFKSRTFIILKPTTFMNLSGKAVNYWLQAEKIPHENLLVLVDDLAIPMGSLRLRAKGGDGGHNGLSHITQILGSPNYARLRFGIGNEFPFGTQVDYVLGEWSSDEKKILAERIPQSVEIIRSFATIGIQFTMNRFNKR
ncbi:MAG: aminoacyl-tRNA hydrolase [Bacteroidales bacterium]